VGKPKPVCASHFRIAGLALVLVSSCLAAAVANAAVAQPAIESAEAGYQRLDRFMKDLKGLAASFRQVLRDSRGQIAEQSSGKLLILRPDRFRWDYELPHAQTVVSDGSRLWLYDPDLEQVTVRPLDNTLAGTPAMLLSGGGELRSAFDVERVERGSEGIFWVQLVPKRADTDFRRVRLGFSGDTLRFMELDDKLNQTTVLEFIGLKRNPSINAEQFTFTPPAGADVIGEPLKPE
jgi:outer membrane lipoprotein carrier protein